MRGFIHFFSYHFILNRKSTRMTRAAGFRLAVRPTVFHPRYFISSESFAAFIDCALGLSAGWYGQNPSNIA